MLSFMVPLESNYSAEDKTDAAGLNTAGDPDVEGWSAQLDVGLGGFGLVAGYSDREFGSAVDSTEYYAGLRYWLGGTTRAGYLMAVGRYSEGLEIAAGQSHSYWGYGVGGGAMTQMTENIFLDGRLMYELLTRDINVGVNDVDLHGLVISLGIVVSQ